MQRDLASLLDRIRLLLEQDAANPSVPILTELENTLTDGYAVALELEGERLRLVRQIGDLAHSVQGPEQADELRAFAQRLHEIDRELAGLREVLQELQRRVGSARAVA
jgi:aminoglycoside phosphotransferase (APT) family kinase protein